MMKKYLILVILIISATGVAPAAHAQSFGEEFNTPEINTQAAEEDAKIQYTPPTDSSGGTSGGSGAFVPLAPIPGLTDIQPTQDGLAAFFNNLYKYLIGLAAVLAIIMIIWGGLEYATQDSPGGKSGGKEKILQAIFGLILVLAPVLVFTIINPSILNLSINFQKLDTNSSAWTSARSGTGTQTPTTDPATQCSVTGTAGVLQIAVCPSATAATTWSQKCTNGNLSTTDIINPANGVATIVVICAGRQDYVFIDPGGLITFAINRLQPLVRTTERPTNGSDALIFTNTCRGANFGLKTCISDIPLFTFETPCQLTGANAQTTWKCYVERLSCEKGLSSGVSSGGPSKCSENPSWTPFQ